MKLVLTSLVKFVPAIHSLLSTSGADANNVNEDQIHSHSFDSYSRLSVKNHLIPNDLDLNQTPVSNAGPLSSNSNDCKVPSDKNKLNQYDILESSQRASSRSSGHSDDHITVNKESFIASGHDANQIPVNNLTKDYSTTIETPKIDKQVVQSLNTDQTVYPDPAQNFETYFLKLLENSRLIQVENSSTREMIKNEAKVQPSKACAVREQSFSQEEQHITQEEHFYPEGGDQDLNKVSSLHLQEDVNVLSEECDFEELDLTYNEKQELSSQPTTSHPGSQRFPFKTHFSDIEEIMLTENVSNKILDHFETSKQDNQNGIRAPDELDVHFETDAPVKQPVEMNDHFTPNQDMKDELKTPIEQSADSTHDLLPDTNDNTRLSVAVTPEFQDLPDQQKDTLRVIPSNVEMEPLVDYKNTGLQNAQIQVSSTTEHLEENPTEQKVEQYDFKKVAPRDVEVAKEDDLTSDMIAIGSRTVGKPCKLVTICSECRCEQLCRNEVEERNCI